MKEGTYFPLGANYSFVDPANFDLKYFSFNKAFGGLANSPSSLEAHIKIDCIEKFSKEMERIYYDYPFISIYIRKKANSSFWVAIYNDWWGVTDYDLHVAKVINDFFLTEALEIDVKGEYKEYTEFLRLTRSPFSSVKDSIDNKMIFTVTANTKSGAANQMIRFSVSGNSLAKHSEFQKKLSKLVKNTGFGFCNYYFYKGCYMIFVGFGRVGVGGDEYPKINLRNFSDNLNDFVKISRLEFGQKGSEDFLSDPDGGSHLVKSNKFWLVVPEAVDLPYILNQTDLTPLKEI